MERLWPPGAVPHISVMIACTKLRICLPETKKSIRMFLLVCWMVSAGWLWSFVQSKMTGWALTQWPLSMWLEMSKPFATGPSGPEQNLPLLAAARPFNVPLPLWYYLYDDSVMWPLICWVHVKRDRIKSFHFLFSERQPCRLPTPAALPSLAPWMYPTRELRVAPEIWAPLCNLYQL